MAMVPTAMALGPTGSIHDVFHRSESLVHVDSMTEDDALGAGLDNVTRSLIKSTQMTKDTIDRDEFLAFLEEEHRQKQICKQLPFTLMYFVSFVSMAINHGRFVGFGSMQRQHRQMLSGTTFEGVQWTSGHKTMSDIDTVADVWTWMKEVVVDLYIDRYGPTDPYRVLRYNQLVGGVMLQQARRERVDCESVGSGIDLISSSFECYPWTTKAEACFGLGSSQSPNSRRVRRGVTGWCTDAERNRETVKVEYCGYSGGFWDVVEDSACGSCTQDACYTLAQCVMMCNLCDTCVAVQFDPRVHTDGNRTKCSMLSNVSATDFKTVHWGDRLTVLVNERHGACHGRKLAELEKEALGIDKEARRLSLIDGGGSGGGTDAIHRAETQTYSVHLNSFEGKARAHEKLDVLNANKWIDYATAYVGVNMLIYNPDGDAYCYVMVHIFFPPSGMLIPVVRAESFPTSLWPNAQSIVLDCLWLALLIWYIVSCARMIYGSFKTSCTVRSLLLDAWTWIDLLVVAAGVGTMILGFAVQSVLVKLNNMAIDVRLADPGRVTTESGLNIGTSLNSFEALLESTHKECKELSHFWELVRLLLGVKTILVAFTFFQPFSVQPRLAVLSNTLFRAWSDIFHFLIVFCTFLWVFIVLGMVTFGNRLWGYSYFSVAFSTSFRLVLGDFDFDQLRDGESNFPFIYFTLFIVLMELIMMNMLMAIIMDVYAQVKSEAECSAPVWTTLAEAGKDMMRQRSGKEASIAEIISIVQDIPTGTDVDEAMLLKFTDSHISREQASTLIRDARKNSDESVMGGITISSAMRTIGWLKLAVDRMLGQLKIILDQEKRENEDLVAAATEDELVALFERLWQTTEEEPELKDATTTRTLQGQRARVDMLNIQIGRIEEFVNEAVKFTHFRGKDIQNRVATIEDLLTRNAKKKSNRKASKGNLGSGLPPTGSRPIISPRNQGEDANNAVASDTRGA